MRIFKPLIHLPVLLPVSLATLLILVNCSEGSGVSSSNVIIPDTYVRCHDVVTDCLTAATGKTAYVGLTNDSNTDCDTYIDGVDSTEFAALFQASGSTSVSKDGQFLIGTVLTWVDKDNFPVTTIKTGSYVACGYIDTNGDGDLDSGEPLGEETIVIDGSETALLEVWGNKLIWENK